MKRDKEVIDLTGEQSPDKKKARRFITALAALPPPPPLPAALRHRKYAIIGPRAQYYNTNPHGFGQALVFGTHVRFVYRGALTAAHELTYDPNGYTSRKPRLLAALTSGGAAGEEWTFLGMVHHWDGANQVWDASYACADQAQVDAASPILLGLPPHPFNLSEIYEPNGGPKKHNAGTTKYREIFRLTLL